MLQILFPILFVGIGLPVHAVVNAVSGAYQCGIEKNVIDEEFSFVTEPQVEIDGRTGSAHYVTPTEAVPDAEIPRFMDDLSLAGLSTALDRQERRYSGRPLSGTIRLGDETYPLSSALESVREMKRVVAEYEKCKAEFVIEKCNEDLHATVIERFKVFRPKIEAADPRYGQEKPVLFTGYYTPLIEATKAPVQNFKHAIYRRPDDSQKATFDRLSIDFRHVLANQGLESYFGDSLFDLYLAHVQGNAKIRYQRDGEWKFEYLNYDGTNSQRWEFISKYMKEKGMIPDGSIQAQRAYLHAHPEKAEEIFSTCPSYVYLRPNTQPPYGSGNVPVTANRSIATDRNYYAFKGLIAFVEAQRPVESMKTSGLCGDTRFRDFSRFFLDQDTGGAIRGKGRVDIYFGEGAYAELAASTTVVQGKLYFLMLRR